MYWEIGSTDRNKTGKQINPAVNKKDDILFNTDQRLS